MTTGQHNMVKIAQKIVDNAVVALKENLVVAHMVTKGSFDQFKGTADEAITMKVPGALPARTYAWRNDRQEPLRADTYTEKTVIISVERENIYSGVKLIDEALEFDFEGDWGKLFLAQVDALVRMTDRIILNQILSAPYEALLKMDPSDANIKAAHDIGQDYLFNQFDAAVVLMERMRCPMDGEVYALAGRNVASLLRRSNKAFIHQGTGNEGAFAGRQIWNYAGVLVQESNLVDPDRVYIFAKSGMVFWNAAPAIPKGAKAGAIQNHSGISMRWLMDYDHDYQIDRSFFSTWHGERYVTDLLVQRNSDDSMDVVGDKLFFLRGVVLSIKTSDTQFVPGDSGSTAGVDGNGRLAADPDSELARVYNNLPFAGSKGPGERMPNVLITAQDAITATATATVDTGEVTAVTVTNPGGRYTKAPVVTITGAGTGATAVATVVDGRVTGVVVTEGGTGYTTAPTVTIAAPVA